MRSSLIRFLSPIILLLSIVGCAHPPPPIEQPQPAYFSEWLPALQARSEHWKSYQARVKLSAQTADKKFNLNAIILARLPDQFRLEAFRLGQTVGVITLNHGQSGLFVPSEKVVYTSDRSESLIDYFLGIPLPLDMFGYSLSASLPLDQLDGLQITHHDSAWLGYAKPSPEGWSYAWQFLSSPQKIQSVRVKRAAWNYTILYEPPVGLAVQDVPQKIMFSSAEWQIELTIQEITAAPILQDAVFNTDFGGEFRHMDLSSLRSGNP